MGVRDEGRVITVKGMGTRNMEGERKGKGMEGERERWREGEM